MNINEHPCFNGEAKYRYGRLHLPVAPKCNIQCNFCNKKYDCVSESRPGVTSKVLSPQGAIKYSKDLIKIKPNIKVVGIAGPGDPFANPIETMETLRLVRRHFPDMLLCIATNGLELSPFIDELIDLKVSHITITLNAVDVEIGKHIYSWVRYGKRVHQSEYAAARLLKNQKKAIERLVKTDIITKINTVIIPGINDHHIDEIGNYLLSTGVNLQNCIPFRAVKNTAFENRAEPTAKQIKEIQKKAGMYITQMRHCQRCRADAAGLITETCGSSLLLSLDDYSDLSLSEDSKKQYIAAVSNEGMLINQHLGEAEQFLIYEFSSEGESLLKETRKAPLPGGGISRWLEVSNILKDCQALLVSDIGPSPEKIMTQAGLKVIKVEGLIMDIVPLIFKQKNIDSYIRKNRFSCQDQCSGNGMGCG